MRKYEVDVYHVTGQFFWNFSRVMISRFFLFVAYSAAFILIVGCNGNEPSEVTENEWDRKLNEVAELMSTKAELKEIKPYIIEAAEKAPNVFPYLRDVMSGEDGEERKSAALMLLTAVYFLVDSGMIMVSTKADDYIINRIGHSEGVLAPLLRDQDLVPTFRDYPHTVR